MRGIAAAHEPPAPPVVASTARVGHGPRQLREHDPWCGVSSLMRMLFFFHLVRLECVYCGCRFVTFRDPARFHTRLATEPYVCRSSCCRRWGRRLSSHPWPCDFPSRRWRLVFGPDTRPTCLFPPEVMASCGLPFFGPFWIHGATASANASARAGCDSVQIRRESAVLTAARPTSAAAVASIATSA